MAAGVTISIPPGGNLGSTAVTCDVLLACDEVEFELELLDPPDVAAAVEAAPEPEFEADAVFDD